jgi:hypothetical protein
MAIEGDGGIAEQQGRGRLDLFLPLAFRDCPQASLIQSTPEALGGDQSLGTVSSWPIVACREGLHTALIFSVRLDVIEIAVDEKFQQGRGVVSRLVNIGWKGTWKTQMDLIKSPR